MLESVFNKDAGPLACSFIKKRLQHRCFPVKFGKFLRIPFLTEHLRWLPLWSATYNCPSEQILILILISTDSVFINIIHTIHTVLDTINAKYYKWNVAKLPTVAAVCRCSSKYVFLPVAAFVSTRKRRRGKRGTKERRKKFQMKEENKNIWINYDLQVLVLVIREMQK